MASLSSSGGAGFLIGGFAQKKFEHQSKNTVVSLVRGGVALAVKEGGNLVYRAFNAAGETIYIGITSNYERRAAEQLARKGIKIKAIPGLQDLSRADVRAVEQVLIDMHGLGKNGGTLLNRINSIAKDNPIYEQAIQRGTELLRQIGYPGF